MGAGRGQYIGNTWVLFGLQFSWFGLGSRWRVFFVFGAEKDKMTLRRSGMRVLFSNLTPPT
jgi:hypothetical protein